MELPTSKSSQRLPGTPSPPRPFRSSSFSSSGIPLSPIVSPHKSPNKHTTPTSARPVIHQHSSSNSIGRLDFSSPRPSTPTSNSGVNANNNKPTTPGSGYTHPYRIQSSASGALTRSNSAQALQSAALSPPTSASGASSGYGYGSWGYQSPTPGLSASGGGILSPAPGTPGGSHRSSKSLSNLRGSVSVDNLASRAMADEPIHFPLSASTSQIHIEPLPLHLDSPAPLAIQSPVPEGSTMRQSLGSGRRYNSLSGTIVRPLVAQWTGESASGSSPASSSSHNPNSARIKNGEVREGDATIKPSPRRVEKFLWPEQGQVGSGAGEGPFGDGAGQSPRVGGSGRAGLTDGERRLISALPPNPKSWTPSDLSTFISISLIHGISPSSSSSHSVENGAMSTTSRNGGPIGIDSQVRAHPKEVVRDIENWVLRHRLDGKSFLRGGEGSWVSAAKPPPFLPVLLSLSRHLRRASLTGAPISQAFFEAVPSQTYASPGPGHSRDESMHWRLSSVLHEESGEENESALTDGESEDGQMDDSLAWEAEDLSRFSKVKRMIGNYDARSTSGSEVADEVTDGEAARPDFVRARSNSVSSTRSYAASISDRVEMLEHAFSPRPVESEGGQQKGRKRLSKEPMPTYDVIPELQEICPFGTIKAGVSAGTPGSPFVGLGISSGGMPDLEPETCAHSPPPAYASPDMASPLRGHLGAPQIPKAALDLTPVASPIRTPRKRDEIPSLQATPRESRHMHHMIEHANQGARPYGALRRNLSSGGSSSAGPRLPTLKSLAAQAGHTSPTSHRDRSSSPEDEDDPRNTGRRVTLKPIPKVSDVFPILDAPRSPSPAIKSANTQDAEASVVRDQLETLTRRLQAAEARIVELEDEVEVSRSTRMPLTTAPFADKLPLGVRELPSYVAMVALGLSFVVIHTILRRRGA